LLIVLNKGRKKRVSSSKSKSTRGTLVLLIHVHSVRLPAMMMLVSGIGKEKRRELKIER
jgi:hypothetical protein